MRKVNVGVIGVGGWGRHHARVLNELENTKLVAVCDIVLEKAKAAGEFYRVDWYTEPIKLLERSDVDAVVIASPTPTHAQLCLLALEMGKHVLVEKPMASMASEALEICRKAKGGNLILMVGFIERFNPAVARLKDAISLGELGRIISIAARRVGRPVKMSEVGATKDLAIHDIDLTRYLLGKDPEKVFARCGSVEAEGYDDYCEIMLTFTYETAFIEANWLTLPKVRRLTVTGGKAVATVDYVNKSLRIEYAEKSVEPSIPVEEPLKIEVKHFADCIVKKAKPLANMKDGLRALEIAEAALKSSSKGKPLKLSYTEI